LRDGKRVRMTDTPFHVRLFSLERMSQEAHGNWNRYVDNDMW
jgi:hypothetical protein